VILLICFEIEAFIKKEFRRGENKKNIANQVILALLKTFFGFFGWCFCEKNLLCLN